MSKPTLMVATLQFAFGGPVTESELKEAIMRAVNTKEFRLVGNCTVLAVQHGQAAVITLPGDNLTPATKKSPEPFG